MTNLPAQKRDGTRVSEGAGADADASETRLLRIDSDEELRVARRGYPITNKRRKVVLLGENGIKFSQPWHIGGSGGLGFLSLCGRFTRKVGIRTEASNVSCPECAAIAFGLGEDTTT